MFKEFSFNNQTYKFWKPFIWIFIVITVLLSYYALSLNDFSGKPYLYSECPKSNVNVSVLDSKCFNGFYHSNLCGSEIDYNDSLCTTEFIYPGQSLGVKPPFIVMYLYTILAVLSIVFILSNHFIFNREFKFPKLGDIQ